MARKKIREYDAKRLFKAQVKLLAGLELPINVVQVNAETNSSELLNANPWLASTKLVVKPDMVSMQGWCLGAQRLRDVGAQCVPCELRDHAASRTSHVAGAPVTGPCTGALSHHSHQRGIAAPHAERPLLASAAPGRHAGRAWAKRACRAAPDKAASHCPSPASAHAHAHRLANVQSI